MKTYIPYMHEQYRAYSYRADKEVTMPRIADYILNCVIYLYPSLEAAQKGIHAGGSGFVVGVTSKADPNVCYTYAVTNAHVINKEKGNSPVIRLNRKDGSLGYINKTTQDWICHPDADDIAVTPLVLDPNQHQVDFYVSDLSFVNKERIKDLDIGIGDDIFIVGRFQAVEGKIQNTPTLRFGNIAQMPNEPIKTSSGIEQESYLVECHSISGFSGSPVFVYIQPLHMRQNSEVITAVWHRLFLGIDWGHILIGENVERIDALAHKWVQNPELRVLNNSAMMGVVPAWKLIELLNQPELMKVREEHDKKIKKSKKPLDHAEAIQLDTLTMTEEEFKKSLEKVAKRVKPSQPDPSKPKT